ncbi:MAG: hypothetical protein MUF33_14770 [Candidatus Nanopelagicales bacterium]|jgi:hypothetical protein|nr:hypothetical protein [Candidatus Nanopelagicales bacterium]
MPTSTADKLTAIVTQVAAQGNADVLRLTVLKKWFERPGRLPAFALWVASRAVEQGRYSEESVSVLFGEARALLEHRGPRGRLDRDAAERLYQRVRSFQSTYQRGKWGPVRIVKNANLLLIEEALALYLWHVNSPSVGYKLAVAYAAHYDPRYGTGLNGPSRDRLQELVDFIRHSEALEAAAAEDVRPVNKVQ